MTDNDSAGSDTRTDWHERPAPVREIRGIIFQSDARSLFGSWFIRPFERLDRRVAGVRPTPDAPSLAMHAGIHVVLEDGEDMVAEQLVGTMTNDFEDGLNWTTIDNFRERDRGGWDVTIPATAFRGIDEAHVAEARRRLNRLQGHPFIGEDCTAFIERAFGGHRMFADSPLLRTLGVGVRVGDPALPLLRSDVHLDPRAERLLRADKLQRLPEALARSGAPNGRILAGRLTIAALLGGLVGALVAGPRQRASLLPGR